MSNTNSRGGRPLRLGLPKGRMHTALVSLLDAAGAGVRVQPRGYRAQLALDGFEVKILKPQNIVEMLEAGSRDLGFAGADWVAELGADLVELLDTGLDPVRVVAAAPRELVATGVLQSRPIVVASEYVQLTRRWIDERGFHARLVRSYGATEVFPPEDADCIVDNTATGSTLRANDLEIFDELMSSSTRLYANPSALEHPEARARIEDLVLLLRSVLEARARVMLEVNVAAEDLDRLIAVLPCMREPTVASLHGDAGYAVKAAVPRRDLAEILLALKQSGGTDIVVGKLAQIVP